MAFLVRLIGANRILELGTYTGYSALTMALALPNDGQLITCDVNVDRAAVGRPFDLVFIDADKASYLAYYEAALRLLPPGGVVVMNNMLYMGRVIDPEHRDPDVMAIRALNERIQGDDRVDCVMLPIGDGVTLVRRRMSRGSIPE